MRWSSCLACAALLASACSGAPESTTASPAPADAPASFTLADVQGCWWMDCGQPHAEFCVRGDRVGGDFENEGTVAVAGARFIVVFPDGHSFNDRIVLATRERLVLDGAAGRVTYRACPAGGAL